MHHQLSRNGPPLHFAHANGFPLLSYQHFLAPLCRQFTVFGLQQRALWPGDNGPPRRWGWHNHAEDLIAFLDSTAQAPVIGVGHSMGGTVSLLAARQRPDLFRALILIDAAGASRLGAVAARLTPRALFRRVPFIARTIHRVTHWPDREAAERYFRTRATWSVFTDAAMEDFLNHALVPGAQGGLKLAFSPAWEAQNYMSIVALPSIIADVNVPLLSIRGAASYVQTDARWRKLQAVAPQHDYVTIPQAGHLLPQQVPEETMRHIQHWLSERGL